MDLTSPSSRLRSTSCPGAFYCADAPFKQKQNCRQRRYSEASLRLTKTGQYGLRKAVLGILMNRLSEGGVDVQHLDPALLNHCLPKDCNNTDWEMMIHTPLKAPDHVVSRALDLRLAENTELKLKGEQRSVLYVRSFQLSKKQLCDVITQFSQARPEAATTATWSECLELLKPNDSVYIRYVGRTERSALLRHRHDIALKSIKSGFLAKFLEALKRTHPSVIDTATIYELPGICLRQFCESKEQILIALLGLPSLVNQRLCETRSFVPTKSHQSAFVSLETDTFLALSSSKLQPVSQGLIVAWATKIQEYTRAHKLSVSRSTRQALEFSDALRLAITRQAQASMINGKFVVCLTIGAEMSLEAWRNAGEFFSGTSDSARRMSDHLRRLWSWETGKPVNDEHLKLLISAGLLPFINLSPWLKVEGKDLQQAIRFAKDYVVLTKPMIILTLGARASSSAASGFNHPFGYPASQKLDDRVGKLDLVDCEGVLSIQISSFHPGKGRYCRNPATFNEVFNVTLWIFLFTINVCLKSSELFQNHTRKNWCRHIKATVDDKLHKSGTYDLLNSMKEKLRSEGPGSRSLLSPQKCIESLTKTTTVSQLKALERSNISGD